MSVMVYRSLVFIACIVFCWADVSPAASMGESLGQVWQVGSRRWDIAEEQRFAAWVEDTITEDFFLRHNIAIDCADVPYAIRWIYARIAHLPVASTLGDGTFWGHWSTAFAHLPTHRHWYRDQRFRAALLHVLAATTTKTLPADTYPIRIAPDSVLAGTVSIVPEGHAGMVGHIVLDGSMFSPVQTWEATVPRKVRKLQQRSYFSPWPDAEAGSGLVRFRWPVFTDSRWRYLPKMDHPFYSVEQYSSGFFYPGELFDQAVARRIDPTPYDPAEKADKIIGSIYRYLVERVALVKEGYRHCHRRKCPEGSYLWEVYSTPSRDRMIAFEIEHLLDIIHDNGLDEQALKKTMEGRVIPIDQGKTVTLDFVVQNYLWLSHDPHDPIEARWGLRKCEMIRAKMQDSLQAVFFVEQRYRSSDPYFADNGRRTHWKDLRLLQAEGERSGCRDLPPLPQDESVLPSSESNQ